MMLGNIEVRELSKSLKINGKKLNLADKPTEQDLDLLLEIFKEGQRVARNQMRSALGLNRIGEW